MLKKGLGAVVVEVVLWQATDSGETQRLRPGPADAEPKRAASLERFIASLMPLRLKQCDPTETFTRNPEFRTNPSRSLNPRLNNFLIPDAANPHAPPPTNQILELPAPHNWV
uniref:Uncharacterized protein n=1 Tax=Compsopogon caeruleus TaxID=31354 RepID=A0A6T6C4N2_9RHOD|mmetsp:Transcript_17216/g.35775  ORF Transcript_17216/g.35775 Transcript_17216/m.35775 type:complete len:112 (+) Transcript_17216:1198-1533(+)